jgi:hypothetical protein
MSKNISASMSIRTGWPLIVNEHVIGSELAVDEAVSCPRGHGGCQFKPGLLRLAAGGCYAFYPGGRQGKIAQCAAEHDLLA